MSDTTTPRPNGTITVATWEEATDGRRDTNPFDFIEGRLMPHGTRVGVYDVVRRYSDEVADCLPDHIDFVDNRFVRPADASTDHHADRQAVVAAISEADARHRRLVEDWVR